MSAAGAARHEARAQQYREQWCRSSGWPTPTGYPPDGKVTHRTWWGKTEARWKTVILLNSELTDAVRAVESAVAKGHDHPMIGQLEAGLAEVWRLAKLASTEIEYRQSSTVAGQDLLTLAASLMALFDLGEERKLVLASIDPASLARTAAALEADLDAARSFLQTDRIDRELASSPAPARSAYSITLPSLRRR